MFPKIVPAEETPILGVDSFKEVAVKLLRQSANGAKETIVDGTDLIQAGSVGFAKKTTREAGFLPIWGDTAAGKRVASWPHRLS